MKIHLVATKSFCASNEPSYLPDQSEMEWNDSFDHLSS